MNILMIILLGIAAILVIVLMAAFFASNDYTIERAIAINKPKNDVFGYIRLLKNQEHYNKWVMTDPAMKKEYKGTDGTVGFIYSWESNNNNVGKGEQEIRKIVDGELIEQEIRFMKPFEGKSKIYMSTESITGSQTKVNWVFSGTRNYFMKVMHLVLNLKKMLGKDLEKSLHNLKLVLEGKSS